MCQVGAWTTAAAFRPLSRPLRWQLKPPPTAAAGGQSLLCHLMTCNDYFLNRKITIATTTLYWIEEYYFRKNNISTSWYTFSKHFFKKLVGVGKYF